MQMLKRLKNRIRLNGLVRATLAWCNERRAEKGLDPLKKLPKGRKTDPLSCPCGTATGLCVNSYNYSDPAKNRGKLLLGSLPKEVQEFVKEFDAGNLPKYVDDSAA
jgi:hypothetical protein